MVFAALETLMVFAALVAALALPGASHDSNASLPLRRNATSPHATPTPIPTPVPTPVPTPTAYDSYAEAESGVAAAFDPDWRDLAEQCLDRERVSNVQRLRSMWGDIVLGVLMILAWVGTLTFTNVFLLTRLRHVTNALTNGTGAAVKARLLARDRDSLVEEDADDELVGAQAVASSKAARTATGADVDAVVKAADGDGKKSKRRAVAFVDHGGANNKGTARGKSPAARRRPLASDDQHNDRSDDGSETDERSCMR